MSLIIEKLSKDHKKSGFDCENTVLNNYIQKQAKQDRNRDLSVCYVLVDSENKKIVGYYTLSGNSVNTQDFPLELVKRMPPSYQNLPTILLGRLAVDKEIKGKGYGAILLMDALKKCVDISRSLGVLAVIVDPIDSNAVTFYEQYGFILLPGTGKMFIPIKTIENF
ncbi:GNAT family N-acetyltransferase [Flavobacterium foetidum]|uniref:GNAT family N-acetyltransferase n=1 Tax=Flavobacterium foetidum TaxID=2026681 RepID=UPI00107510F2|nr:GNAT family N-acetyltransferase [Flavobacterium foetidum]KAF2516455.1 GNAT family N-acetyltransferase [Flavobacterium foetidum]